MLTRRGRCSDYYEHQVTVGKCDSGMAPDTCDVFSPVPAVARTETGKRIPINDLKSPHVLRIGGFFQYKFVLR